MSAYALTVESGTPLGRDVAAGRRAAPDDDDQAEKYEVADDVLTAAGLEWYEISNWARPGDECRHNLLYWDGGDYLAIGCAAHGKTGPRRWWNLRTPERYIDAVRAGRSPEAGDETLEPAGRAAEALAPRAADAVRGGGRRRRRRPARGRRATRGWWRSRARRVRLTRRGRLVANEVTVRLQGDA